MTDQNEIARRDVQNLKKFRTSAENTRPSHRQNLTITASEQQRKLALEQEEYYQQQQLTLQSFHRYVPLFTQRISVERPGDTFNIYLSAIGSSSFTPINPKDDDDSYLASWADPRYGSLVGLKIGDPVSLGKFRMVVKNRSDFGGEELNRALFDVTIRTSTVESKFEEVRIDASGKVVFKEKLLDDLPSEAEDPDVAALYLASNDVEPLDILSLEVVSEPDLVPNESRTLSLETIVKNEDGRRVAIPFALDEKQWSALSTFAGAGTIVVSGPPGTGKTTVVILRATKLLHSVYEYDDDNKRISDLPTVDLRQDRFRVFVVTSHLRGYLKEFLASSELGLKDVPVEDLRGEFLASFVRHPTLTNWIRGRGLRLNEQDNKLPETLIYIKARPETLRLCFFHAVLNAEENLIGIEERITRTIRSKLLDIAAKKLAGSKQRDVGESSEGFLARIGKLVVTTSDIDKRLKSIQSALTLLKQFLSSWMRRSKERCDEAINSAEESLLVAGGDDLLLCSFVEDVTALRSDERLESLFFEAAWQEVVRLVDPQQVLLRVVEDYKESGEFVDLLAEGLTPNLVLEALDLWENALTGKDRVGKSEGGSDVEENDDLTLDDLESDAEAIEVDVSGPRGSFTRSDFPLLAGLARVFLALPSAVKPTDRLYNRVGFSLPGDVARYDHVVVDEAQDFTYAELHLVASLVEPKRRAVSISGDPFQRMQWKYGFKGLESISVPPERYFDVKRNYRQTKQLGEWLQNLSDILFGAGENSIVPGHEPGESPEVTVCGGTKGCVAAANEWIAAWYAQHRSPYTALLLIGFDKRRESAVANSLGKSLSEHSIQVLKLEDGRLIERGPVTVAEVATVKGLEFENIVVFMSKGACEEICSETPQARVLRNQLYVASSRAKSSLKIALETDCELLKVSGIYD